MNRPCNCNNCVIGKPYEIGQCRNCWLYHNDARYHNMWNGKKDMPPIIQQAGNFVGAVVKRIQSNFKNVTPESFNERLKICGDCVHKTDDWRCNLCGCVINTKAKWASEDCPEKRWPLAILDEKKGGGCGCSKKT